MIYTINNVCIPLAYEVVLGYSISPLWYGHQPIEPQTNQQISHCKERSIVM